MEALAPPLALAVIFAFIGYRQWLRHQQRVMVHKERLVAIERGVDPPAWPEAARSAMGVQDVLLLSGLIWLALGIGGMIALFAIMPHVHVPEAPPAEIGLVGVPVALVGAAHLIVYGVLRRRK